MHPEAINYSAVYKFHISWQKTIEKRVKETVPCQVCQNLKPSPGSGLPEKYDGRRGPKVKLNPKPKKIPILGQFGTPKNTYI